MNLKLLLDSHVLIWLQAEPDRISKTALTAITDKSNIRFVSVATFWELTLKCKKGRLELKPDPETFLAKACKLSDIKILPVEAHHVFATQSLPGLHSDPFDQLIVAQAQTEQMTLITADSTIRKYPVSSIW